MEETKKQMLDEAYNNSFFTILGTGGDLQEWKNGINNLLAEQDIGHVDDFIVFSGKDVNDYAELKGKNAFKNDLTILAFSPKGLHIGKLAMFKLMYGARWFDDIVDNARKL